LFRFIGRDKTALPDDYLPDAPGALIADEGMLRAAGYVRGSYRPRGWDRVKPGVFEKSYGGSIFRVRQCGNARSEHWVIERLHRSTVGERNYEIIEALVFAFQHSPIWASSYQAAMRLAEYCHPIPRPPVGGFWIEVRLVRICG
jgi:hypothetical protein